MNSLSIKRKKVKDMFKQDFKQPLTLSVNLSCLLFNDVYYKQVNGITMGSPLGPILANFFDCIMNIYGYKSVPYTFDLSIIVDMSTTIFSCLEVEVMERSFSGT